MKIAYTRPEDGGLSIVVGVEQESILNELGCVFAEQEIVRAQASLKILLDREENDQEAINILETRLNHLTKLNVLNKRVLMVEEFIKYLLKEKAKAFPYIDHMNSNYNYFDKAIAKLDAISKPFLSEDEIYEHMIWKAVPDNAINPRIILDDEIPSSREFRNAWKDIKTNIDIDLLKAKDIQLTRLRAKRDALLDKYDKLMSRAVDLEDENSVIDVRTKKQQLRDATEVLKNLNPTSVEEIKSATPSLEEF